MSKFASQEKSVSALRKLAGSKLINFEEKKEEKNEEFIYLNEINEEHNSEKETQDASSSSKPKRKLLEVSFDAASLSPFLNAEFTPSFPLKYEDEKKSASQPKDIKENEKDQKAADAPQVILTGSEEPKTTTFCTCGNPCEENILPAQCTECIKKSTVIINGGYLYEKGTGNAVTRFWYRLIGHHIYSKPND
jgi:hypothetical protein